MSTDVKRDAPNVIKTDGEESARPELEDPQGVDFMTLIDDPQAHCSQPELRRLLDVDRYARSCGLSDRVDKMRRRLPIPMSPLTSINSSTQRNIPMNPATKPANDSPAVTIMHSTPCQSCSWNEVEVDNTRYDVFIARLPDGYFVDSPEWMATVYDLRCNAVAVYFDGDLAVHDRADDEEVALAAVRTIVTRAT